MNLIKQATELPDSHQSRLNLYRGRLVLLIASRALAEIAGEWVGGGDCMGAGLGQRQPGPAAWREEPKSKPHSAQTVVPAGLHSPFHDRVHPRHPDPAEYHVDARVGGDGAGQAGELPVPVCDQEPCPAAGIVQVHHEVPGGLRCPGRRRVGGGAQDPDSAAGVLSVTESTCSRTPDRVTVSKKPQASRAPAWERRKSAHVVELRSGAGSIPASCRISQTVEAATLTQAPATRRVSGDTL